MTPRQHLLAEVRCSIQDKKTVSHRLAREIAETLAPTNAEETVADFVLKGYVPERLAEIVPMYEAIAFGHLEGDLTTALANYLRSRLERSLTGPFWDWELLIH